MKSDTRTELLNVLLELSKVTPDVRLGQLISNLACHARGAVTEAIWDVEDEELLEAARKQLETLLSEADVKS